MTGKKVSVTAYAGYKGQERPVSFSIDDEKIEVIEITDMWIEEGYSDRSRRTFFRVRGDDGYIHIIWHDEKSLKWFLKIK